MVSRTIKCFVLEKGDEIKYESVKDDVSVYLNDGFIITGIVNRKYEMSYNDFMANANYVEDMEEN